MPNSINKIQTNSSNIYDLTAVYSLYATCETAAWTGAKVAKLADSSITSLVGVDSSTKAPLTGMHLFVRFSANNSAANPTLTVQSSTGTTLLAAKSMKLYGSTSIGITNSKAWKAGAVVDFVYDGTNWVQNYGADSNPVTVVDGITREDDYGFSLNRYCTCSTASATANKDAYLIPSGNNNNTVYYDNSGNGWAGLAVYIQFSNQNTANSPAIEVGDASVEHTGYLPVYYEGKQITTGNEKYLLRGVCLLVCDGSHWHLISADNPPIQSKTYTGVIGTANDWANATFFFGKILPTSYYALWRIKYRVYVEAAGTNYSKAIADVCISGTQNTYSSYYTFNSIESTSYRPVYHHELYCAKEAGITGGYGHLLGERLASSWNPTTAANSRTFVFDIIGTENCDFVFFDSPVKYSAAPGTGSTNYNTYYELDFANQGLQETGDNNTVSTLRLDNAYLTNGTSMNLPAYSLFCFDRECHAQAISLYSSGYSTNGNTTNINTARVYNTVGLDWTQGIVYNTSWYQFNPGANVDASWADAYAAIDLRYTDNCVASTSTTTSTLGVVMREPIYFRGIIKEDGLFYLQPIEVTYNSATYKRVWTQEVPTTEETVTIDGHTYQYVYWFLGFPYYNSASYAYNLYYIDLDIENKMYWYHNNRFEEYNTNKTKITIVDWSVN